MRRTSQRIPVTRATRWIQRYPGVAPMTRTLGTTRPKVTRSEKVLAVVPTNASVARRRSRSTRASWMASGVPRSRLCGVVWTSRSPYRARKISRTPSRRVGLPLGAGAPSSEQSTMPASGIVARNRSTATSIAAVFQDRSGRIRTKSPRRAWTPIMRARKRRARNAATRSATAAHASRCPSSSAQRTARARCAGKRSGKVSHFALQRRRCRSGATRRSSASRAEWSGWAGRTSSVGSWSTSITGQSPANSSRNAAPHSGVRGQISVNVRPEASASTMPDRSARRRLLRPARVNTVSVRGPLVAPWGNPGVRSSA